MAKSKSTQSNKNTMSMVPSPATIKAAKKAGRDVHPGTKPGITVEVTEPPAEFVSQDMSKSPLVAEPPAKKARQPKGLIRDTVMLMCRDSGLPIHEKGSSTHVGDPKAVRLVVPRGSVTKLYIYKLEDASLPGYHTAEQRKERGIGSVSHIVENPDLSTVEAILAAVSRNAHEALASAEGISGEEAKDSTTPADGTLQNDLAKDAGVES